MEYKKRSGGKTFFIVLLCMILSFASGIGGAYLAVEVWGKDDASNRNELNFNYGDGNGETTGDASLTGVDAAAESVVEIMTTSRSSGGFYGSQNVTEGAGSGVIVTTDGSIVTNNHVVEGASSIQVRLRSGKTYEATLVGTDDQTDVALIKIEAEGLTAAPIGSSAGLSLGENVFVIGNPLGQLGGTVTRGIISALDREITLSGETMNLLQTDAAVNPGNSGGGMFDANGKLVGIVVAKTISTDVEGLGFAIPIDDVTGILEELQENGYVTGRAYMGITMMDITDAQTMMMYRVNRAGVYVLEVAKGSGAEKAGIKEGDCILTIDEKEIKTTSEISSLMDEKSVGDVITVKVLRSGEEKTLTVTLGEYKPDGVQ
ncbi:MAG: PDZ domain-containing protein [Clostridiales bacterium]|nr:PDZ domain-containing protein [Clostridiales bacterium]